MNAEQLAQYAGVVLSLAVAYIPKLAEWYASKDSPAKARIMGGLLIVTALGIFGLGCASVVVVGVTCDKAGALQLVQILIAALIANQATFLLMVKPFRK
jgi:hypothetical protein